MGILHVNQPITKTIITIFVLLLAVGSKHTVASESDDPPVTNHKAFDLTAYKGKVVYLDFWASWCIPCRKSFPWMNKLQTQYSQNEFQVVTINLDKERVLADNFLSEYPANFEIYYDPKGTLAKKYHVKGMPSSVLFNADGKPVAAHKGFFTKRIPEYELEIRKLIAASNLKNSNKGNQ